MNQVASPIQSLPAMQPDAVEAVRKLESLSKSLGHVPIPTDHLIHGGMYARTICIPAGVVLTGALLKVPTVLVIHGDVTAFTGNDEVRLTGFHVLPGSAGRKSAFIAHADTHMTMVFPSQAQDVQTAEGEFTDEAHLLISRTGENRITITGETP